MGMLKFSLRNKQVFASKKCLILEDFAEWLLAVVLIGISLLLLLVITTHHKNKVLQDFSMLKKESYWRQYLNLLLDRKLSFKGEELTTAQAISLMYEYEASGQKKEKTAIASLTSRVLNDGMPSQRMTLICNPKKSWDCYPNVIDPGYGISSDTGFVKFEIPGFDNSFEVLLLNDWRVSFHAVTPHVP